MLTSNYARLKRIPEGFEPVSISIKPPYWWGKKRRHYPPLCPTAAMLQMTPEEYNQHFDEILSGLDPAKVFADLGDNSVLLCFESPGVRCHRRRVSEWLETALGIVIPEMGFDRSATPAYLDTPSKLDKPPKPKPPKLLIPESNGADEQRVLF